MFPIKTSTAMVPLACMVVLLITATSLGAPKDSPVSTGGEGATGNDWVDYGFDDQLPYRRNGVNGVASVRSVQIVGGANANPNFTVAHACDSSQNPVTVSHYHTQYDYDSGPNGAANWPTKTEANDLFNWFYAGYTPAVQIQAGSDPTIHTSSRSTIGRLGSVAALRAGAERHRSRSHPIVRFI